MDPCTQSTVCCLMLCLSVSSCVLLTAVQSCTVYCTPEVSSPSYVILQSGNVSWMIVCHVGVWDVEHVIGTRAINWTQV